MSRYQIRDTATGKLLAENLPDYDTAEGALDRLDDELEQQLGRNGEGAGRIRLRLDVEELTTTGAPPRRSVTTSSCSAPRTRPTSSPSCSQSPGRSAPRADDVARRAS